MPDSAARLRSVTVLLATLVFLAIPSESARAQREWNTWYFGRNVGLFFDSAGVRPISGPPSLVGRSATAIVYSDPRTGRPFLYTDGMTLYNRDHLVMQNGTGLAGSQRATQPALILPHPGDSSRMFVFTSDHSHYPYTTDTFGLGISYSLVDMCADAGRGAVVEKNVSMLRPATTRLTALRLCDGSGYWIAAHEWGTNRLVAWRLTAEGLSAPVVTALGSVHGRGERGLPDGYGQMSFSPDGSRLAVVTNGYGHLELFRFDQVTGVFSEVITLLLPYGGIASPNYGVLFSPDGRLMYTTEVRGSHLVTQWDVTVHDRDALVASRVVIETQDPGGGKWWSIHPGPDGKLYLTDGNRIDAIEYPNRPGLACGFRRRVVTLDAYRAGDDLTPGLTNLPAGSIELGTASAGADAAICPGDSTQLRATGNGLRASWSPADGLSCVDCLEPAASPDSTTTYVVTLSTAAGCSIVDSLTVTLLTPPTIRIAPAGPLCNGDSITLTASGGVNYRWSSVAELSCRDCPAPAARPAVDTWFHVEATDSSGCIGRDSVLVRVVVARASAGPNVAICAGDTVTLTGSDGIAWQWEPAADVSCDTCRETRVHPTVTTVYRLEVTSPEGCTAESAVTVVVIPKPDIEAYGDTAICPGRSAVLGARGGVTYNWLPVDGLSCTDCAMPVATPIRTTLYRVLATDATGCSNVDSVLVTVVGSIVAKAGEGDTICSGDSVRLSVDGGNRWHWEPSEGLSCTDCQSPMASPQRSMTYVVEVRNDEGCVARDSVRVSVAPLPVVEARGDTIICGSGVAMLRATGALTYEWSPATGLDCSDCAATIARPTTTTTFTVVGRAAAGCADTATVTVTLAERQTAIATIDRGVRILPGGRATLQLSVDRTIVADTLAAAVTWNRNVLLLEDVRPASALSAAGWTIASSNAASGSLEVVLTNPVATLVNAGAVIELDARTVLGDSLATELPFTLRASESSCTSVETRAGQVVIDSICGLSFRLIESSDALLKLRAPAPNPIHEMAVIRYSIPFACGIELRLLDSRGVSRTLVSGMQANGEHELLLDVSTLAGGRYELQLRVGDEVRSVPVVVVK